MKCLILAAGYATRLYPLTENFPKPLLKVGEKSILDWLVDDLVENTEIDEFIVISNHKFAQQFDKWKDAKEISKLVQLVAFDRKGYKKKEPGNVSIDAPSLFYEAYQLFKTELHYTDSELSHIFHLPIDVINHFCIRRRTHLYILKH